jgi:hypothetical protein
MQNEHRLFRSLWVAAKRLLLDAEAELPQNTWRLLGATICAAAALEGFLCDLGSRIAPAQFADERAFFSGRDYRGTIGKLKFLAERIGLPLDWGRRPLQSLSSLDRLRNQFIHPRSTYGTTDWSDGVPAPQWPPAIISIEEDGMVRRMMEDLNTFGDMMIVAAKQKFSYELRDYGTRAFEGALAGSSEIISCDVSTENQ